MTGETASTSYTPARTGELMEECLCSYSCSTARHCPTGMIFIPCKDGISHNPVEYSTPEDW
jgi:acetylornithine deacetylase/succinyl-diaminopimelate desuccinylase-like protein